MPFGFDDPAGERGYGLGEADPARAQCIDRILHVVGGVGLEPSPELEYARRRCGHQSWIADDFRLVGCRRPGEEDLRFGQEQRIGAVERGLGRHGLVSGRRLDRCEVPARAQEQDCAEDGEAEDAERQGNRGDVVAVRPREGCHIGVEAGEFVAPARRGADAITG